MGSLHHRIRVLIADDHPIIRSMVRATLRSQPQFKVCAEAENGAEAIDQALKSNPDVVVLNVTMPVLNRFDAAREIKTQVPHSAIVILSTNADKKFVEEAMKLSVRAYVAKSKAGEALVKAVEAAVLGEGFVVLE